jgi:hypothetical protein
MRAFVLSFCLLCATAAHAQDFDAAAKHFGNAQAAFGQQHFKVAAGEFEAAYAVTKDPILLYNIAESWEKAGDGKKAVARYRDYLKAQPNAGDKAEVNRRIKAIEAKKYKLVSQSAPGDEPGETTTPPAPGTTPPATLSATPEAPPAPAPAPTPATPPPGATPVAPEAPPAATATPAPEATPAPAPEPAPAPAPAPVTGVVEERPSSKLRVAAWIGVAATVAVLTAGAIFGLAAQSRADEIDRQLNFVDASGAPKKFDQATQDNLTNLKSDGNLYNGLAIGFFSAAGALAITTTVLFVLDWRHHKESRTAKLRVAPTVGKGGAGLVAGWSF